MFQKSKISTVPSDAQAKEKLALYVYEYLTHVGAPKAAQSFLKEINWDRPVQLAEPPGFLFSWWSVFWDLYCAAPERRDTTEHSNEAKAFHDYGFINSGQCNGYIPGGARMRPFPPSSRIIQVGPHHPHHHHHPRMPPFPPQGPPLLRPGCVVPPNMVMYRQPLPDVRHMLNSGPPSSSAANGGGPLFFPPQQQQQGGPQQTQSNPQLQQKSQPNQPPQPPTPAGIQSHTSMQQQGGTPLHPHHHQLLSPHRPPHPHPHQMLFSPHQIPPNSFSPSPNDPYFDLGLGPPPSGPSSHQHPHHHPPSHHHHSSPFPPNMPPPPSSHHQQLHNHNNNGPSTPITLINDNSSSSMMEDPQLTDEELFARMTSQHNNNNDQMHSLASISSASPPFHLNNHFKFVTSQSNNNNPNIINNNRPMFPNEMNGTPNAEDIISSISNNFNNTCEDLSTAFSDLSNQSMSLAAAAAFSKMKNSANNNNNNGNNNNNSNNPNFNALLNTNSQEAAIAAQKLQDSFAFHSDSISETDQIY